MDFSEDLCENSSVSLFNSSEHIQVTMRDQYGNAILLSIFGTIWILGITGNSIVIYTIIKKTKCQAKLIVPDMFIFNLSIADLLFLLGVPFLIHQLLGNGSWCFGATMCKVITALDLNSQTVSTYILTVMTLDCYVATVHPFRFNHIRTPCVAGTMVGMVWTLSLISITPVLMYTGLMPLHSGWMGCALLLPNPSTNICWFTIYHFVLTFTLPLIVICVVFFKILKHMSTTVAPLPLRNQQVRTKSVTRMAVAICLAFFICWAPYYFLQLVHLGIQKPNALFYYVYHIAISMGYANSCINPFLYIILSKTFKRQIVVAIQPMHNHFQVNPSTTVASVLLRMAAEFQRHCHSDDSE
ncbi:melanin-concentrating hormone receptor 1-like [Xyrauchen texanus]|uniref:melanin-concentrating hormone receptor 1-like n=1 Tax=Xyrauchen texanus TaxID=154827 RepID=UPI002241BADB|nr:melanin-concentrating hormone receptor 1-like [Xyrauchen texanus]